MSFDRFQHPVVSLVSGCCTHFPTDLIGNLLSQILLHRLSSLKTPRQGDRLCLKLYCAELSVQLGVGFSHFYISNIEYRIRLRRKQQKFLKGIRPKLSDYNAEISETICSLRAGINPAPTKSFDPPVVGAGFTPARILFWSLQIAHFR